MKKQGTDTITAPEVVFGGIMAGASLAALWCTVSLLFSLLA